MSRSPSSILVNTQGKKVAPSTHTPRKESVCCLAQSADGILPELHPEPAPRVDQHQHMKRRGSSFLRLTSVIAEGRSACIKHVIRGQCIM